MKCKIALFTGLLVGASLIATGGPPNSLQYADKIKTSDHAEFSAILEKFAGNAQSAPRSEFQYWQYLSAWEDAYDGRYDSAIASLDRLREEADNPTLRFRAQVTAINVLQIVSRYEDAFRRLVPMLDRLPNVADRWARAQGLSVAAGLYNDVAEYGLGLEYASLLVHQAVDSKARCKGVVFQLQALLNIGKLHGLDEKLQAGIALCSQAGEVLHSNKLRTFVAELHLANDDPETAIRVLTANRAEIQRTKYAESISLSDSWLALAYWRAHQPRNAERFAMSAVTQSVPTAFTDGLRRAYHVLYLIAKQRNDDAAALAWHEKYMAADTAYLNEVSAKALAFQKVNQQVLAKERRIAALNDQNRILGLQQNLTTKSAETTRLYVLLLGVILSALAFWAWRVKRSQIAFRKLAQRDSLTGIFNRQHFMDAARAVLQYDSKSTRESCLILLDLDHFKQVNDDHGHATGDSVLKRAVAVCAQELRSVDVFGRLGGEEFGILVPDCGLDEGASRAEQMRLAIASRASDDMPEVSASFGVASTLHGGHDLRDLLAHADAALYRAKRAGRNTVAVSDADPVTASAINV